MSYDDEILEFKRMLFLGARIAKKKPLFQKLASMGYEEARLYAVCEFYKYFEKWCEKIKKRKNKEMNILDMIDLFQKHCELVGAAELMPTLKELTRISMILGDTREFEKWKKEKDGNTE